MCEAVAFADLHRRVGEVEQLHLDLIVWAGVIRIDHADDASVAALFERVKTEAGQLNLLVNNAAGNFSAPTERLSHRAVDAVLNIVLHGSFYCTLALGKRWIEAKLATEGNGLTSAQSGVLFYLGGADGARRAPDGRAERSGRPGRLGLA